MEKNQQMKKQSQTLLKILTLVSLLCLLIPLSIYSLWIYVFDLGTTQTERVFIFKSYFPDFLDDRWSTTLLSIFLCASAIFFSSISFKLSGIFWKGINVIILITSSLLLFLNLFSMM